MLVHHTVMALQPITCITGTIKQKEGLFHHNLGLISIYDLTWPWTSQTGKGTV